MSGPGTSHLYRSICMQPYPINMSCTSPFVIAVYTNRTAPHLLDPDHGTKTILFSSNTNWRDDNTRD